MVYESRDTSDWEAFGPQDVYFWRCYLCSNCIDFRILKNREDPPVIKNPSKSHKGKAGVGWHRKEL